MLTSRISEMTELFEHFHVDVLRPGNTTLPPGYIHAVISIGSAAMIVLSFMREDWLDIAEYALQRETALVDSGKKLDMKLIQDRRRRDLKMFQRLIEMDMVHSRKVQLRRIIDVEEETLARWND